MREKFKNLRKRKKKQGHNSGGNEDDEQLCRKKPCLDTDEYKSNVKLLKEELKKKKPKSKTIMNIMDDTEQTRRTWITTDGPSVQEVLTEYPSLRFQRWVCNVIQY